MKFTHLCIACGIFLHMQILVAMHELNEQLGTAVLQGDYDKAQEALEAGADPHVPMSKYVSLPLVNAAWEGHLSIVELLITYKVNVNQRDALLGMAALHVAVVKGHEIITKYLLAHGADPLIKNKHNQTSVQLAEKQGNPQIARLLQGGGRVPQINPEEG